MYHFQYSATIFLFKRLSLYDPVYFLMYVLVLLNKRQQGRKQQSSRPTSSMKSPQCAVCWESPDTHYIYMRYKYDARGETQW